MPNIQLLNGDCLQLINNISNNSIDLVITSPPYNVDLGNNKYKKNGYSLYKDNKEHVEYIKWLKNIFISLYDKIKNGGRIAINIGDGKNGKIPTHSDIINFMCNIGYIPYSTIIWNKKQTANRAAWGSYCSPSSPSFPAPFEYILIFCKGSTKLLTKGKTDLTKEEFVKYAYGVWEFPPETKMKKFGHPAMFPEELPYRLIKMLSYKESTILDPFMGSGTVGIVCKNLNRNFIGIEIDEKYFEIAKRRISNA